MKSKIGTIIFLALLAFEPLLAQTPKILELDKGAKLFNSTAINNGLVLLTGKEYFFRAHLNWNINYYYPDLTLRYKIPISKPILNLSNPGHLVVSPSGNHVYYLQHRGNGNKQSVTALDSLGVSANYMIKREFKYNRLNVAFADDEYLYYVTKEKNKESKRRKSFPKLQFVRMGHNGTVSKVMLELPDPEPDATEWSYLGHTTEVSYFVSRTIEEANKQVYRIAVTDADGKLQDDFKLEVVIKDAEFRAGYNHSSAPGTWVIDNHNITVTTHTYSNGAGGTTTSTTYSANPEAFGDISLDQQTGGFYIYGLSGPKYVKSKGLFSRRSSTIANNYYVFKFDQDGKKIWDYQGKLGGMNDYYMNKASFMARQIQLNTGIGGTTRFQAFTIIPPRIFVKWVSIANTYELNTETGKFITGYSNEFQEPLTTVDLGTCHKSGDKTDLGKFMSKKDKGEFSMEVFRVNNVNILLRNFYDDYKVELYRFDDE